MKKVFILLVSLLAMMLASLSAKAQEVTINLLPGWNWISYTNAEAMDIAMAMGDFVPMEGDVIKSSYGFAEYSNGSWIGGLQQFTPGLGYMYFSNRTSPVSFVYVRSSSLFAVTTAEPTDITYYSATCGGTVTVAEDDHVFLRGVCWSTEPNPTVDDNHTTDEPGIGSWSVQVWGLPQGVTYYVRAYAVSDSGLKYGDDLSFTTLTIDYTDHDYVDLGLPNGTLWATCNVGATAPEGYGDYFAWGETNPKAYYDWGTYQYCNGNDNYNPQLTKYCSDESFGYNGFTDDLTTLLPEDDAATAHWGTDWRMPTGEEWQELVDNTTITWTTQNGVNGMLFTAMNGNSLFLPDAGVRFEGNLNGGGCCYWSSSLFDNPTRAICGFSEGDSYYIEWARRFLGYTVRAVRSTSQSTSFIIEAAANPTEGGVVIGSGTYEEGTECEFIATANEGYAFVNWTEDGEVVSTEATYSFTVNGDRNLVANFAYNGSDHAYVDLCLPSGLLWATCNVGADNPEDYGYYFAWGETQPKDVYNWSTYQYCNGSSNTLTKYTGSDGLTTLLPEDDAATTNWGSDWRMPTYEEWQELLDNTTVTWTTQNGVNGQLFTASNGNSLFLPAAGYRSGSSLFDAGSDGFYWSSSLYTVGPDDAWYFYFGSDGFSVYHYYRYCGHSVRGVRSSRQN